MKTYSIDNTTPQDILRKEAFKRTLPSPNLTMGIDSRPTGNVDMLYNINGETQQYVYISQQEYQREFDVNSHKINSIKYYPDPFVTTAQKLNQKIKSRVAVGFQSYIFTQRLTALIGNNVNMKIISHNITAAQQDTLAYFREGWDEFNGEVMVHEALSGDGKTGDVAVCFFVSDGEPGWRVFSFDKGDILFPHPNPITGKLDLFGRLYSVPEGENGESVRFLDVWDKTYYVRYREDTTNGGTGGWVKEGEPAPHGFPRIPIAYHRYGEPFWDKSQSLIDNYEMAMSQFSENNAAYALRILVALGADLSVATSLDGTPTRIDSPDANAKVSFLEPADASASFEKQLEEMRKAIFQSSFVCETPEIKSGSDLSSLTVKMLMRDSYLKGLEDAQNYQKFLDDCVWLYKHAYGVAQGRISLFDGFKVKAEIWPFIFMSDSEIVNILVQAVGSGIMSKGSATEKLVDLGYSPAGENGRRLQEAHDELVGTGEAAQNTNTVNQARVAQQATNQ